MAAADCAVSPPATNEPKARLVPVMSPARKESKESSAAGSSLACSSSTTSAPSGLSREWSTCRKLSRRAVPVPLAATRAGGIPCKANKEFSRRSRINGKESGGSGPSRCGVTSAGSTNAPVWVCSAKAVTSLEIVSGVRESAMPKSLALFLGTINCDWVKFNSSLVAVSSNPAALAVSAAICMGLRPAQGRDG